MLVEETYKLIDIKTIQHAVDQLKRANQIFLLGTGASGNCCLDLAQKLTRVNFQAIYHIDPHTQLTADVHITDQDVAIGISYSGATKEVTSAIQYAKSRGAHTIAITQHNKNELHKLADSILVLPYQENEFRLGAMASRNATLIYTDLLYLGMISNNLDDYKEILMQTRKVLTSL